MKRHQKNPSAEMAIYGQEKVAETVRLCRMNLAVRGLSGDIRQGNSYYEDIHSLNRFDFVMYCSAFPDGRPQFFNPSFDRFEAYGSPVQ